MTPSTLPRASKKSLGVEFISSSVTLEPIGIISTGTAAGVGHAKGVHLKVGDQVEASIEEIGALKNTMV
jgi:2-keto-4-pentenoate hydratase/2-oxohepta-3-ene-1,7-dioic acid hydratase in catechol pathway